MTSPLVLSLFPGIGLLDRAFEEEGFCVVRGPDLLWGGDVRRFHPPAGRFDGVVGGPPCKMFSALAALQRAQGRAPRHGNLIPEFERCVAEAAPDWWLMENVPQAPEPQVPGYARESGILDNHRRGQEQGRVRRFTFGARHVAAAVRFPIRLQQQESMDRLPKRAGAVTSSDGGAAVRMSRYTVPEMLRLQGLPSDFLAHAPFTVAGTKEVIANGVPLPMGRAVARAVKRALGIEVAA